MRLRVLSAVAVMLGFYLLALGIAGALLFFVFAELAWGDQMALQPTIFAILTAGAILWSILPRAATFVAPGPRLEAESQPELFELVRGLAAETEQAMPDEIYLAAGANAFVMHRGGFAGFGTIRVMGIGLPLLQTLTRSQLRAVLAHEFGHYAGGDLNLGGWIYKTRDAIRRTVANLARTSGIAHRPFVWYGNFFLRVTQKIARVQEIAADRLAARVAGARSHAEALKAVHGIAPAFESYWAGEVLPVVSNGFRPPIGAGFAHFLRVERVATAVEKSVREEIAAGKSDPYDSHPPLAERLAAIGDLPDVSPLGDDPPAVTLVRDLPRLERELLVALADDPRKAGALPEVEWHDTAATVFLPQWRRRAKELAPLLGNATAADVPRLVVSRDFAVGLGVLEMNPEQREPYMRAAVAAALAAKLADDGWSCTTAPGEQVVFTRDGVAFAPFEAVFKDGAKRGAWFERVVAAGIETLPLA